MCGLVGFAGNNLRAIQKAFSFMLLVDQVRGFHSTGIATASNKGPQDLFKRALNATDFLDMKQPEKIIGQFNYSAIMGHNRAATVGLINTANAHPFQVGDITLAHNGTLRNQSLLPDYKDYDVDSENICHSVNKIGIDETVKKLCGAFALTYFDATLKTLNLVRNSERPLYYAITKDKQSIMWASEQWMLWVGAQKNGITLEDPQLLDVGKLMTIDLDVNNILDINSSISFRELELYSAPKPYVASYNGYNRDIPDMDQRYNYILKRGEVLGAERLYYGKTVGGQFDVTIKVVTNCNMTLGATYQSKPKSWSTGKGGRKVISMGDFILINNDKKKVGTGTGGNTH